MHSCSLWNAYTYAYAKAQFAYAYIYAYMPAYTLLPNRQVEKTFVVNLRTPEYNNNSTDGRQK